MGEDPDDLARLVEFHEFRRKPPAHALIINHQAGNPHEDVQGLEGQVRVGGQSLGEIIPQGLQSFQRSGRLAQEFLDEGRGEDDGGVLVG
jgi:hypothetical protein